LYKYYWDNGNLKIEGDYKNNKQNGLFKQYWKSGDLKVEVYYNDGEIID